MMFDETSTTWRIIGVVSSTFDYRHQTYDELLTSCTGSGYSPDIDGMNREQRRQKVHTKYKLKDGPVLRYMTTKQLKASCNSKSSIKIK